MTIDVWSLVLQVATLLAVVVAAWQLLFHSRQMHREFEAMYIARYWELMDRRSTRWVISGRQTREDCVVAKSYLQLCEDEIDCRRIGRVTDNTWAFWREAIISQTAGQPYRAVLQSSDAGDYPRLRELISVGSEYEPLRSMSSCVESRGLLFWLLVGQVDPDSGGGGRCSGACVESFRVLVEVALQGSIASRPRLAPGAVVDLGG